MYQSSTVSSVVGAPWRCGVLTTQGWIDGIGLGALLGGGHDSTPQSGVEAPRGASASSRKKTERPQIGLLLQLLLCGSVVGCWLLWLLCVVVCRCVLLCVVVCCCCCCFCQSLTKRGVYVHSLLRTNCAGALDDEELFIIEGSENWRSTPGQPGGARKMPTPASPPYPR